MELGTFNYVNPSSKDNDANEKEKKLTDEL
jgi:hypothetical protein